MIPPQPYVTQGPPSLFAPFPALVLPFLFDARRFEPNVVGSQVTPGLLLDINIDPGVAPTGNFWLGTNPTSPVPFRRLFGAPGATVSFALDSVIMHGRLTFVRRDSSARTIFYDGGVGVTDWTMVQLTPSLDARPAGTSISLRVRGADGLTPLVGDTPMMTYIDRFGVVDPSALAALSGKRFIQLTVDFESDHRTNAVPFIDDLIIGLTR